MTLIERSLHAVAGLQLHAKGEMKVSASALRLRLRLRLTGLATYLLQYSILRVQPQLRPSPRLSGARTGRRGETCSLVHLDILV